jgi:pilus assembly protein Flp/PilA
MKNLIKRFIREEEGQDLVEYALLLALIALVVALLIPTLTTAIGTVYTNIAAALT